MGDMADYYRDTYEWAAYNHYTDAPLLEVILNLEALLSTEDYMQDEYSHIVEDIICQYYMDIFLSDKQEKVLRTHLYYKGD